MKDIQGQRDHRRINIKKVGVKNISYPVTVLDRSQKNQKTVATVNMYVNLPHHFKGTHMSRFVEILNRFHGEINLKSVHVILEEMKAKLQAEESHLEMEFPYFLKRDTGHGRAVGIGEYQCKMHGSLDNLDDLVLTVEVPISPPLPTQVDDGLPRSLGHWGLATISLRFLHFIWIEDLIKMVEEVTNHDLCWPSAEKQCSDQALSVESISKALGEKLKKHTDIKWFSVQVENFSQGFTTFASLTWPENTQQLEQ